MNNIEFASALQNGFRSSGVDFWKKYNDVINCLSVEQKEFVGKQETVINAKNLMYQEFIDYLFESNKDAFVSVADGKHKAVVNNYIESIRKAAENYVSRTEQLEKENAELREQIKQVLEERKHVESVAADGSGRIRESNSEKIVRKRNNSGNNGIIPESNED